MAETVGDKVSELLARVRDQQGVRTSRSLTVDILSQCQRLVNARTGRITSSASLTLYARQLFYSPLSDLLPGMASVTGVQYGGSNLDYMPISDLRAISPSWFRDIGSTPIAYSLIGREVLVIYPGIDVSGQSATVDYVSLLDDFETEESTFEFTAQDTPPVLDLAEVIILTAHRRTNVLKTLLGSLDVKLDLRQRRHPL